MMSGESTMPRPNKMIPIPWEDTKGLKTLIAEGKTYDEIGKHFGVCSGTISNRVKEHRAKIQAGERDE